MIEFGKSSLLFENMKVFLLYENSVEVFSFFSFNFYLVFLEMCFIFNILTQLNQNQSVFLLVAEPHLSLI